MVEEQFAQTAERLAVPLDEPCGLDLTTDEVCREQDHAAAVSWHAALISFVSVLSALRIARLAAEAARRVTAHEHTALEDFEGFQGEDGDHRFDSYCWLFSFDY